MRILIITVAGVASRFNADLIEPIPKCIYSEGDKTDSILYRLISRADCADKIIVVGGYMYENILSYAKDMLRDFSDRLEFVYNPHFKDKGSMYSLKLGIDAAAKYSPDIISFAEGDLVVPRNGYTALIGSECDAVSINHEIIYAKKAVILYVNGGGDIRYVFDTSHSSVRISDTITAIFNSAQMWCFANAKKLIELNNILTDDEAAGTNLVLIQKYFSDKKITDIRTVEFEQWYNCNTVEDYRKAILQCK